MGSNLGNHSLSAGSWGWLQRVKGVVPWKWQSPVGEVGEKQSGKQAGSQTLSNSSAAGTPKSSRRPSAGKTGKTCIWRGRVWPHLQRTESACAPHRGYWLILSCSHLTLLPSRVCVCVCVCVCVHALITQSRPTLCFPTNCSLPGSSVFGILRARILEWIAIPSSRPTSWVTGKNRAMQHTQP